MRKTAKTNKAEKHKINGTKTPKQQNLPKTKQTIKRIFDLKKQQRETVSRCSCIKYLNIQFQILNKYKSTLSN